MTFALVVQELLFLYFESLYLKVLVKLILLLTFRRNGQTYNKIVTKINIVQNTKIFSMTCRNVRTFYNDRYGVKTK
jgi:hypothetical protein